MLALAQCDGGFWWLKEGAFGDQGQGKVQGQGKDQGQGNIHKQGIQEGIQDGRGQKSVGQTSQVSGAGGCGEKRAGCMGGAGRRGQGRKGGKGGQGGGGGRGEGEGASVGGREGNVRPGARVLPVTQGLTPSLASAQVGAVQCTAMHCNAVQ